MQNPDNGGEKADSGEGADVACENVQGTANECGRRIVRPPQGGILKPWPKGVSGNPRGRRKAGLVYEEWLNVLAEKPMDEVRKIADSDSVPVMQRAAARDLLDAQRDEYHNATPLRADPLNRVLDRTVGKPTQRMEVQRTEPDPTQVLSGIAALLARRPDLAQRVAGVLPGHVVADVVPDAAETVDVEPADE